MVRFMIKNEDKLRFKNKVGDISVDVATNLSSNASKDESKKYTPECILIDMKKVAPGCNPIDSKIDDETRLRFESKIEKMPNGCWIWTDSKTEKGYGRFFIDGKQLRAHRVAYELYIGEIPEGMLVCHNCPTGDNPSCCNPAHLWLGSHADNQNDKMSKGRHHCDNGYVVSDENRARNSELHKGNSYNLGRTLSDEHKAKISAAHIGRKLSDEHRAKVVASLIGRRCSEETKEKHRANSTGNANALGKCHSDETKAAKSKSMIGNTNGKGKVRSPESRERYRQAALRRVMSAETKAKISESLKGKTNALGHSLSDSAKARISEANKGNTNTLGKTLSDEHKAKISTSLMGNTINLGRKQDPEIVAKRIAKTHETMRINKLNNI